MDIDNITWHNGHPAQVYAWSTDVLKDIYCMYHLLPQKIGAETQPLRYFQTLNFGRYPVYYAQM